MDKLKFIWYQNRYKMVQFTKEIMMLLRASLAVMWFPLWFCLFNMHFSVQCTRCRWPEGIQSEKSSLAIMCCHNHVHGEMCHERQTVIYLAKKGWYFMDSKLWHSSADRSTRKTWHKTLCIFAFRWSIPRANLALGEDNLTYLVIQVILLKSFFLSVEHLYVVDLD